MSGYLFDDGGRAAAGYRGSAGDCVTRAIAIATGIPYQEVYDELARRQKVGFTALTRGASPRNGVGRYAYDPYLVDLGWRWTPTMKIGSGCRVHLRADELPGGRLIVRVSKHLTAMIDGVIRDTFDPRERGTTIFSPNTPKDRLPKGAYWLENGNGWAYAPERCVYGYWEAPQKEVV